MKHKEGQIGKIVIKVLADLNPDYPEYNKIDKIFFSKNTKLARGKDKGKEYPCWIISINSLFGNIDFLTILDETGEPLYYQNFNTIIRKIEKGNNENYQWEKVE